MPNPIKKNRFLGILGTDVSHRGEGVIKKCPQDVSREKIDL